MAASKPGKNLDQDSLRNLSVPEVKQSGITQSGELTRLGTKPLGNLLGRQVGMGKPITHCSSKMNAPQKGIGQ